MIAAAQPHRTEEPMTRLERNEKTRAENKAKLAAYAQMARQPLITQVMAPIERRCWLGFGDRVKCPNMCAGRLCGYAKS
jgi:hypothetical protein